MKTSRLCLWKPKENMTTQRSSPRSLSRKTTLRAGHSTAFRAPLRLFSYVLMLALALSAASCRSAKTVTRERVMQDASASDSSARSHRLQLQTSLEPVKADSTRLTIPLDSLLRLPEGASYTARSGRAHVSVSLRRTGDVGTAQQRRTEPGGMTVYVESGCDSLARLCSYYEEENERLSVANSHQTATMSTKENEEKTSARVWLELLSTFIAGLLLGGVITLITTRKWTTKY